MPRKRDGNLRELIDASRGAGAGVDRMCVQVSRLVEEELGIVIPPERGRFIHNRLKKGGYDPTNSSIAENPPSSREDRRNFASLFCTHETSFYRENAHFQFLSNVAIPAILSSPAPRALRGWSAACSSGEEAYTLAMTIDEALPSSAGWRAEVLGTDVSDTVLERARNGDWDESQEANFSITQLKRYMKKGRGPFAGRMRANEYLRSLVSFAAMNLTKPPYPVSGTYDFIFCRNVLIYFRPEIQCQVVRQLSVWLRPGGYLFTGLNEGLGQRSGNLEQIAPSIYQRK